MWLFSVFACSSSREDYDTAAVSSGQETYTYANTGVACLRTQDGLSPELLVDFGDCLSCIEETALYCEASLDGSRIVVAAGGNLLVNACEDSTCRSVTARCEPPALEAGAWTLSYAGVEVEVSLPSVDWVCTGESAAL